MRACAANRLIRDVLALIFLMVSMMLRTSALAQNIPLGKWDAHFNYLSAHQLVQTEKRLFCASYNGLLSIKLDGTDLKTYSKQDGFTENGIAAMTYEEDRKTLILAYRSGNIDLVELDSDSSPKNIISWPILQATSALPENKKLTKILLHDQLAYLTTNFGIVVIDIGNQQILETYRYIGAAGAEVEVKDIAITQDSIYALTSQGLISSSMNPSVNRQYFANWKSITTPAPVMAVTAENNKLFAGIQNKGIYQRKDSSWTILHPNTSKNYRLSHSSEGITAIMDNSIITFSEATINNTFVNSLIVEPKNAIVLPKNIAWIADSQNGLLSNFSGAFQQYNPSNQDTTISPRTDSSIIDLNRNIWTRLPSYLSGGILVKNASNNKEKFLNTSVGNGGLPSSVINSLAIDQDGYIWFASDKGVGYISPDEALSTRSTNAILPIYGQRKLFSNEKCTAIVVESGNKKWIGTRNGLYLFSSDGTEQVEHFTTANSPLPSNDITSLKFESETGLLYIDTPHGMMSYQTNALAASESLEKLTIFPNPVRAGYAGPVGFKGLTENATVKITQLSGRLVHETSSNGGIASWNLNDYTGRRVKGGIYMIFIHTPDGNQKLAGKLAIIE